MLPPTPTTPRVRARRVRTWQRRITGTMAHLRVEPEDPHAGTLAIVARDALGGVAWHLRPITAP
jgi:hypothetical protein